MFGYFNLKVGQEEIDTLTVDYFESVTKKRGLRWNVVSSGQP